MSSVFAFAGDTRFAYVCTTMGFAQACRTILQNGDVKGTTGKGISKVSVSELDKVTNAVQELKAQSKNIKLVHVQMYRGFYHL